MTKVQEKALAIALRKQGHTYKEILERIPSIAKGTLSRWCNSIELTPAQLARIERRMQLGRARAQFQAILTNRKNREKRDSLIRQAAEEEFQRYKNDPFFSLGIALYWAEGSKKSRRFQFMNSDPLLVGVMIKWIEKYLKIPKDELVARLYIHKIYEAEKCDRFWQKATKMPRKSFLKTIYKPTAHSIKKNQNYKGCLRIEARTLVPWLKTMAWRDCLIKLMRL